MGVLLGDPAGVFLSGGMGVFLGSWTRVVLGDGTGVAHGGGFPLGVVDLGPPVDVSSRFGVLAPWPGPGQGMLPVGLEMTLNISSFHKSSLKYTKSTISMSTMSVNEDLHSSTVVGMYLE